MLETRSKTAPFSTHEIKTYLRTVSPDLHIPINGIMITNGYKTSYRRRQKKTHQPTTHPPKGSTATFRLKCVGPSFHGSTIWMTSQCSQSGARVFRSVRLTMHCCFFLCFYYYRWRRILPNHSIIIELILVVPSSRLESDCLREN